MSSRDVSTGQSPIRAEREPSKTLHSAQSPINRDRSYLRELVDSWKITLQTERKSKQTLALYIGSATRYLDWCQANQLPELIDRRQVQSWVVHLIDSDHEAATVKSYQGAVRRFAAWLAAEGEIDTDPLVGMKAPKLDDKVVDPLTEEELQALLKTCDRKTFTGIRDEAIIRVMNETIARPGEVAAMLLDEIDAAKGAGLIRRGKGGKGRPIAFGPKTAQAIDRYLRNRRRHKYADSRMLWIGHNSPTFSYWSLYKMLKKRAARAGIENFHPHRTRHTGATRWLANGGSEGGLMAVTGWSSRAMLDRYTRATAQARAATELRRLDLGDI